MPSNTDLAKTEGSNQRQRLTELPTIAPPVDIYENDEEILLVADLPGLTRERPYGYARVGGGRYIVADPGGPARETVRIAMNHWRTRNETE